MERSRVNTIPRYSSPGNQRAANDKTQDGKQVKEETAQEDCQSRPAKLPPPSSRPDQSRMERRKSWEPSVYNTLENESFYFTGHDICIHESIDTYGALTWPGAVALCRFLENNQQQVQLMDKEVLEIGAGTGLVSIVASLLGARVTATDLPDVLSNLTFNLLRNTRGRSRYTPQVSALTWGQDLERDFPYPSYHYDYVLAADVVYPHKCLEDLLKTLHHFCRPGSETRLLWANKIRFQSDLRFTERFKSSFNAELLTELPQQDVRIYKATAKE